MSVSRGELSALPSSLTGKAMVCKWDHVGPPLCGEAWSPGSLAPVRLTKGKGVVARSGNGPLGFNIHCKEFDPNYESPSLGHMAHTVLCMALRYSLLCGFIPLRQMLLQ